MNEMPKEFYYFTGTLIVANIGVVISILTFIFKGGMFVSETRSSTKDAKDCAVRAHVRIDDHLKEHTL